MVDLTARVVSLNEDLYQKTIRLENEAKLESDVQNLKNTLSSIERINAALSLDFIDRYNLITSQVEDRINQLELKNAIVSDQGIYFTN